MTILLFIAGSSNGRIADFESVHHGSNPCPATLQFSLRSKFSVFDHKKIEVADERSEEVHMFFFVYILECSDKTYYIGYTNDLKRRIRQHNKSKWGAHYTKLRRPVVLKYFEEYKILIEARRREAEIKGWRREKKEALINENLKVLEK